MEGPFDDERIIRRLKGEIERLPGPVKRITVQGPDGILRWLSQLALDIQERIGVEVVVLADPCYGACDLGDLESIELDSDLLLHIGHAPISSESELPVVYEELRYSEFDPSFMEGALPLLGQEIGIISTIQFLDIVPRAMSLLEEAGRTAHLWSDVAGDGTEFDRSAPMSRIWYPGQVLGCNIMAATALADEVDSYLFIGTGRFHPLGVALSTDLPVVTLDPLTGNVGKVDSEPFIRCRYAVIASASECKRFGVLVGLKRGQRRLDGASEITNRLRAEGYEAVALAVRDLSPPRLKAFGFDAYISTLCPRVAIDDSMRYEVPVITAAEVDLLIDIEAPYVFDQLH